MIDMYKALVATSRWERERRWGFRVKLIVRPLTLMFLRSMWADSLLRFGNAWQEKMRAGGIECREAELLPSNAYQSDYIIRILTVMSFTSSGIRFPTVWFALSMY